MVAGCNAMALPAYMIVTTLPLIFVSRSQRELLDGSR